MADHSFSERRACRLIGVNRSAWQYEPLRGQNDAVRERMRENDAVRERMREIANERRRSPTGSWRSCSSLRARA